MENIAPSDVWTALIVILSICAALITVDKAINVVRSWKKPATSLEVEQKLANDKRRIDKLEEDLESTKECMGYLCAGVKALLDHELHDGNADEMNDASTELNRWLIRRK